MQYGKERKASLYTTSTLPGNDKETRTKFNLLECGHLAPDQWSAAVQYPCVAAWSECLFCCGVALCVPLLASTRSCCKVSKTYLTVLKDWNHVTLKHHTIILTSHTYIKYLWQFSKKEPLLLWQWREGNNQNTHRVMWSQIVLRTNKHKDLPKGC